MSKPLLLIKIGGSIISDKDTPGKALPDEIDRLVGEISKASSSYNVILSHGGGSFGHIEAHKYMITKGLVGEEQRIGTPLVRDAMLKLDRFVFESMIKRGMKPHVVPPSTGAIGKAGRIANWDLSVIMDSIEKGFTPVTFGDVINDVSTGISVIPAEETLRYIAAEMHPAKVIVAGDIDGVFTADPNLDKNAKIIPEVNNSNLDMALAAVGPSTHIDVTGGMKSKLMYLVEISKANGVPCQIVNGRVPGRLAAAIEGKAVTGTVIKIF